MGSDVLTTEEHGAARDVIVSTRQLAVAAQWRDQPRDEWPSWWRGLVQVDSLLEPGAAALLLAKRVEIVRPTEWLVRTMDGVITKYSDVEFRRQFQVEA